MDIGILGSLYINAGNGQVHTFLAPKPRTVLATLLANAGQTTTVSALVREVWGDSPPASSLRIIQTYILSSRKALSQICRVPVREIARDVLVTCSGGYMFNDAFASLDSAEFHRRTASGRAFLSDDDHLSAHHEFTEALNLWRGPVFSDVTTGNILETRRRQLTESRLYAVETLLEIMITNERYAEAAIDLASLVHEHPHHEGFHSQYMRVLERTGRRTQALEIYLRLRNRLVSDFGIEPGASMQQLQHHILTSSANA